MSVKKALQDAGVQVQPTRIPSELIEMPESQSLMERLAIMGFTFRLNVCTDSIEVNGQRISDSLAAEIRVALRDNGLTKKIKAAEDAYVAYARRNAYHPIKEYLESLKWDGKDHISILTDCMQSDDPMVEYSDGTVLPLHYVYWYRWLIGSVAKIFDQAQLPMLVLDSVQDLGKSTFVRWLCPLPNYFIEGSIRVEDKDADIRLTDKWIWEVAELDATTRKADQSALKSFITRKEVTQRGAYRKYETVKPAMAALIGTVNNSTGFLTDDTGNRRFMIVRITALDFAYERIDIHQVWAQAYHLWQEKQSHRLIPEERRLQAEINKRYEVESTLNDWLDRYFIFDPNERDMLFSLADILKEMSDTFRLSGSERAQAMELARVLTSKGAIKVETRIGKRWTGLYKRPGVSDVV